MRYYFANFHIHAVKKCKKKFNIHPSAGWHHYFLCQQGLGGAVHTKMRLLAGADFKTRERKYPAWSGVPVQLWLTIVLLSLIVTLLAAGSMSCRRMWLTRSPTLAGWYSTRRDCCNCWAAQPTFFSLIIFLVTSRILMFKWLDIHVSNCW